MKILSAYGDLPGLNFVEFLGKKRAEAKSFFFKLCLKSLKKIWNVSKKLDNAKQSPNWVLRETYHASDKFLDSNGTADKISSDPPIHFRLVSFIPNSNIYLKADKPQKGRLGKTERLTALDRQVPIAKGLPYCTLEIRVPGNYLLFWVC